MFKKDIVLPIIIALLIGIVLGYSVKFCPEATEKAPEETEESEEQVMTFKKSNVIHDWLASLSGKVTEISDRELTLLSHEDTLKIPIPEGVPIKKAVAEGEVPDIEFEEIKVGDTVDVVATLTDDGLMALRVTVFPLQLDLKQKTNMLKLIKNSLLIFILFLAIVVLIEILIPQVALACWDDSECYWGDYKVGDICVDNESCELWMDYGCYGIGYDPPVEGHCDVEEKIWFCSNCSALDGWGGCGSTYLCCKPGNKTGLCQDRHYYTYTCTGEGICSGDITDTALCSGEPGNCIADSCGAQCAPGSDCTDECWGDQLRYRDCFEAMCNCDYSGESFNCNSLDSTSAPYCSGYLAQQDVTDGYCAIGECQTSVTTNTLANCNYDIVGDTYCIGNVVSQDTDHYWCFSGACDVESTTTDSLQDCDDLDSSGDPYCYAGNVYHDVTDGSCVDGACTSSTNRRLLDACNDYWSPYYCVGETITRDFHDGYCSAAACHETTTTYSYDNCDDFPDGCSGGYYINNYCSAGNSTCQSSSNCTEECCAAFHSGDIDAYCEGGICQGPASPETSITCNGQTCATDWYTTDVKIDLECNDPGGENASGCASTYYCVDQADACSAAILYTGSFYVRNEGINYVRFYSVDYSGHAEVVQSPHSQQIKIDKSLFEFPRKLSIGERILIVLRGFFGIR